jgi:hypothetical protein
MRFNLLQARRGQLLRVVKSFILEFRDRYATRGDPAPRRPPYKRLF